MAPPPPIIDSHIHLYPTSALDTLAWCPPSHPLHAQHSIDQYLASTSPSLSSSTPNPDPSLHGFIFIEADRKSSLHPTSPSSSTPNQEDQTSGWTHPLSELTFASRIRHGTPLPNESHFHSRTQAPLLLGIVPWAPIPLGAAGMTSYVSRARATVGAEAWGLVKGFRYLVQDKRRGTMGMEGFVEGVRWCGREGFVFELGVDVRGGGLWQLEEGVGFLGRVYAGLEGGREGERVVVVIGT